MIAHKAFSVQTVTNSINNSSFSLVLRFQFFFALLFSLPAPLRVFSWWDERMVKNNNTAINLQPPNEKSTPSFHCVFNFFSNAMGSSSEMGALSKKRRDVSSERIVSLRLLLLLMIFHPSQPHFGQARSPIELHGGE